MEGDVKRDVVKITSAAAAAFRRCDLFDLFFFSRRLFHQKTLAQYIRAFFPLQLNRLLTTCHFVFVFQATRPQASLESVSAYIA